MDNYQKGILQHRVGVTLRYVFLCLMAVTALFPVIWVFFSGFKTNSEIYLNSLGLPREWLVSNYVNTASSGAIQRGFFNTLFNGGLVLFFSILIGAMTSYVSARVCKTTALHTYFAFGIMVPMQAILVPLFIIMKQIGLTYTRVGIVLAYVATVMPITVFVLHGFMMSIPREMEEAAMIDGCSKVKSFLQIILPMSKPGLATVLTMNLLTVWNDYLLALVIGGKKEFLNLTVVIYNFRSEYAANYGVICAGLMLSIIPMLLIYILLQEQIIRGMAEGAVKA